MPNNRHRAIERYECSRYKKRLYSAARRARSAILDGFKYPQCIADMAKNIAGEGLKLERLPERDLIMASPGRASDISHAIQRMYAAAKADDIKYAVIPIDSPGGYMIDDLPEGVQSPYDSFIEEQHTALTEFLLTGEFPEKREE